ncbi:MAG: TonB family protein [Bacteroidales bacterium]
MINEFITYSLESSFALTLFLLVYLLFLRKETFFKWNRIYLMGSFFISLLFPFVELNIIQNNISSNIVNLPEIMVSQGGEMIASGLSFSYMNMCLSLVYLLVAIFLYFRFGSSLFFIIRLISRNTFRKEKHIYITETNQIGTPFSFLRYCFLPQDLKNGNRKMFLAVLNHEKVHIKQKHTFDRLFFEFLFPLFWLNPSMWLFRYLMQENHEYEADYVCVKKDELQSVDYQKCILSCASYSSIKILGNYFGVSQIKRRIVMITQKRSSVKRKWKYLLVLPVAAILLIACNNNKSNSNSSSTEKATPVKPIVGEHNKAAQNKTVVVEEKESDIKSADGETIYNIVDKNPQFPGGIPSLMRYLSENIKYPLLAKQNGTQGKVHLNFIIEKDGSIGKVKILRGIGDGCDQEAIRVVKNMPKWIPGENKGMMVRVSYNLPIKFSLKKKAGTTESTYKK